MSDALDLLKEKYPIFEFENKLHIQQSIPLADGDTATAMPAPHGKLRIRSEKFTQLPSTKTWKFIQPSLADLRDVGFLTEVPAPTSAKKVASKPAAKPDVE
ncbi:hypothetical protein [Rhizobium phage RHph_N46]|nr:hypothetical protein [Rhizobium phage RHph_N46]